MMSLTSYAKASVTSHPIFTSFINVWIFKFTAMCLNSPAAKNIFPEMEIYHC